jgi:hypothetical protein
VFGRKKTEKSVTVRFQGKEFTLKEGWFFKPDITIESDGDIVGTLTVRKNLDIEVISID